jgi:hypothetical protein
MSYPPPPPTTCRYCGSKVRLVDDEVLYGQSYGSKIFLCQNDDCQARVGTHDGSKKPLGILADEELRRWRSTAHAAFDPIWQKTRRSRRAAYKMMQNAIGVSRSRAHIAMLDTGECKDLIRWLMEEGPSVS